MPPLTANLILSVLAGVVIGKLLVRGLVHVARRTGHADRIERRTAIIVDRGIDLVVDVSRSEAGLMLLWVVCTVCGASAFILGMGH